MRTALSFVAIFAAIMMSPVSAWAGQDGQDELGIGKLLIASEKLGDPTFAESVIVIVNRDSDRGTVGLMVNRRTNVPLSRLFSKRKDVSDDPVYIGGPVDLTLVQVLLRSSSRIEKATHVIADVYSTEDKNTIEKYISHSNPFRFHLYLGYAGWAPGQLEAEIRLGAWSVMDASPGIIFDSHPDSLWIRLNARLHMQIVELLYDPKTVQYRR
jgi:putative transcriptional regulator